MEQAGHHYLEAAMEDADDQYGDDLQAIGGHYAEKDQDVGDDYGENIQVGQAPNYSTLDNDTSLSNLLNDYMSSEDHTPSKSKHTPAGRSKYAETKRITALDTPTSGEDDEMGPEPDNDNDEDFEPEPITPKKVKRKLCTPIKTPRTPRNAGKGSARSSACKSTPKAKADLPFNRQRRPPTAILESRAIPRSYEECDEADKALIDMREQGKIWKEVRVAWEALTGLKTGVSTLPNRYERLKDNFSIIREEDRALLLQAKLEVEKEQNDMKWQLIADRIAQAGGDEYGPDNLQRQYKKLMVKEGMRPPPGIVDPDFNIKISDDEDEVDDDDDG